MKRLTFCLVGCTLLGLVACTKSEPGGGPDRASKFTIEGPVMATSIPQGATENVALKINRGKEFAQTVKVKADAPSGIEVAVHESPVKASEKGDVNLKVAVAKNASPGEHVIHVTGTPDTGAATSLDIKVKVTERSDSVALKLNGPSAATTIKQGESQTIKVNLEPYEKFTGDVKVAVEAPKGLKTELTPGNMIRSADKGATNLRVTADKDAPLGEHTIQVTGTATGTTVSPVDVRVKVVAP